MLFSEGDFMCKRREAGSDGGNAMGLLVEGVWQDKWYDTKSTGGKFSRSESAFRDWITPDGRNAPDGCQAFPAARDRYHLYVSLACPWAHRTLIFRHLKGLQDLIPVTVVNPVMGGDGWSFAPADGSDPDPLYGFPFLRDLYVKAKADYTGRVTVPVLWDRERETIVSNESAEIIRMFNSAFDGQGAKDGDYYPEDLRAEIDEINEFVYHGVNNGVYKAGFATSQEAYEEAVTRLFDCLDDLETRLSGRKYLLGDRLTEADWRLFTTLVRFDAVYVGHFKCNIRRLSDYPALWGYCRALYQMDGIADLVNFDHIRKHYYMSHPTINPTGIVPKGPVLDFLEPHGR